MACRNLIVLTALLGLGGCGPQSSTSSSSGSQSGSTTETTSETDTGPGTGPESDTGTETATATGTSTGGSSSTGDPTCEAQPVTFRLENPGPASLFVQAGAWPVLTRDAMVLRWQDDCAFCSCQDCVEFGCAICGAPLAAVQEIPAGGNLELSWDGLERFLTRAAGCGAECMDTRPPGCAPITATVRYSDSFIDEGGEQYIGPPVETLELVFDYPPPDGTVVFEL